MALGEVVGLAGIVLILVIAQKAIYLLLIDRKRTHELEEERELLKTFPDKERAEKNQHEYLFQTTVPATLSSFVVLFSFAPIAKAFGTVVVRLPFKIPGIVRGFPPFGMRDYFGWLYLFTLFLVVWSILTSKIVYSYQKERRLRESLESDKKGGGL